MGNIKLCVATLIVIHIVLIGYSLSMSDINLFSINTIAIDIAREYYLKDYPVACKDGVLVFSSDSTANRGDFGNISVARVAALIPYIVKIYLDYKDNFNSNIKTQIDHDFTSENVKILQVVALMRASGRWKKPNTNPLTDPVSVYEEQSITECKKKLQELGVNTSISNNFAMLLKSNNSTVARGDAAYYAILQDAILITDDVKPSVIEANLQYLSLLDNNAGTEIKSKFASLIQGMRIAKIRQQGVIAESETAFHPITLSFKRILGSLFPDMDATFATLGKKTSAIAATSVVSAKSSPTITDTAINRISESKPKIDVRLETILLNYHSLSKITQAINDFTNNVDNIQSELGDNKAEYAGNLYKAWEQTWNNTYAKAMMEFKEFKDKAQSSCKTPEEYLAAIEEKLKEIEHG